MYVVRMSNRKRNANNSCCDRVVAKLTRTHALFKGVFSFILSVPSMIAHNSFSPVVSKEFEGGR